jgi:hypothetical protein
MPLGLPDQQRSGTTALCVPASKHMLRSCSSARLCQNIRDAYKDIRGVRHPQPCALAAPRAAGRRGGRGARQRRRGGAALARRRGACRRAVPERPGARGPRAARLRPGAGGCSEGACCARRACAQAVRGCSGRTCCAQVQGAGPAGGRAGVRLRACLAPRFFGRELPAAAAAARAALLARLPQAGPGDAAGAWPAGDGGAAGPGPGAAEGADRAPRGAWAEDAAADGAADDAGGAAPADAPGLRDLVYGLMRPTAWTAEASEPPGAGPSAPPRCLPLAPTLGCPREPTPMAAAARCKLLVSNTRKPQRAGASPSLRLGRGAPARGRAQPVSLPHAWLLVTNY